jgi:hypothetical protein
VLLLVGWPGSARADSQIDLRKTADLKMLYDGGLRPGRKQGQETSILNFDADRLTVTLPDNQFLSLKIERGYCDVGGEEKLAELMLEGEPIPLDEGLALAKAICEMMGAPVEKLNQVKTQAMARPNATEIWSVERQLSKGVEMRLTLQPMMVITEQRHIAKLTVSFNWEGIAQVGIGPRKPPAGYEQFPMVRPTPARPAVPNPELDPNYHRKLIMEARVKAGLPPEPEDAPKDFQDSPRATPQPPAATPAQSKVGEAPPKPVGEMRWGLIAAGVAVVLVAIAGRWVRRGRS